MNTHLYQAHVKLHCGPIQVGWKLEIPGYTMASELYDRIHQYGKEVFGGDPFFIDKVEINRIVSALPKANAPVEIYIAEDADDVQDLGD